MPLLLVLPLLVVLTSACRADEYAVVVSKATPVTSLSARTVREIFLRKREFSHKVRVYPVNVLGDEAVRRRFERRVLHMSREALNRYWIESHFQGVSPPPTQASLLSVKRFVERVEGAIGYLPLSMVDDSLRVVHEF